MPDFNIDFFTVDTSAPRFPRKPTRDWLSKTIRKENKNTTCIEINFIFCDDNYLLSLNYDFLKKETLTDVITFDYSEKKSIKGDVFISVERVNENAVKYHQKKQDELFRVMVHGVLHLLGYNDITEKEKIKMTEREDFYLSKLGDIIHKKNDRKHA